MSKWTMPEWMEPYRDSFYSTGGNTVEELMNAPDENPYLSQTNIILFTMAMMAEGQVSLLMRLREAGYLAASTWHEIKSADDLPKEDGTFLWQKRTQYIVGETVVFEKFCPNQFNTAPVGVKALADYQAAYVRRYAAWMPIPTFTQTAAGQEGKGE